MLLDLGKLDLLQKLHIAMWYVPVQRAKHVSDEGCGGGSVKVLMWVGKMLRSGVQQNEASDVLSTQQGQKGVPAVQMGVLCAML